MARDPEGKVCTKCRIWKPFAEFCSAGRITSTNMGLSSHCKACYRAKNKAYTLKPTGAEKARQRSKSFGKKRYAELRQKLWDYLLSHPCIDCGEADPVVLDFDHVDPTKKEACIVRMVGTRKRWDLILEEIAKCEVRCSNCHRRRHYRERNNIPEPAAICGLDGEGI